MADESQTEQLQPKNVSPVQFLANVRGKVATYTEAEPGQFDYDTYRGAFDTAEWYFGLKQAIDTKYPSLKNAKIIGSGYTQDLYAPEGGRSVSLDIDGQMAVTIAEDGKLTIRQSPYHPEEPLLNGNQPISEIALDIKNHTETPTLDQSSHRRLRTIFKYASGYYRKCAEVAPEKDRFLKQATTEMGGIASSSVKLQDFPTQEIRNLRTAGNS